MRTCKECTKATHAQILRQKSWARSMNTSGLTPLEFFVIVELDPVEEKTAGGVFLPTTTQDKDELSVAERHADRGQPACLQLRRQLA
jgi:hypothetical protein